MWGLLSFSKNKHMVWPTYNMEFGCFLLMECSYKWGCYIIPICCLIYGYIYIYIPYTWNIPRKYTLYITSISFAHLNVPPLPGSSGGSASKTFADLGAIAHLRPFAIAIHTWRCSTVYIVKICEVYVYNIYIYMYIYILMYTHNIVIIQQSCWTLFGTKRNWRGVATSFSSPVTFLGVGPHSPMPHLILTAKCFTYMPTSLSGCSYLVLQPNYDVFDKPGYTAMLASI